MNELVPTRKRHNRKIASHASRRHGLQFARRNLSLTQRAELALLLKPKAKENQKGGQGGLLLPQKSAEASETRKELDDTSSKGEESVNG